MDVLLLKTRLGRLAGQGGCNPATLSFGVLG